MRDFPDKIATRQDIINLLAVSEYRERMIARLQRLMDGRYEWRLVAKLEDDDEGVTLAGLRVITITTPDGTQTERYQQKWDINTFALDRLQITAADCVAWGCIDREVVAPE